MTFRTANLVPMAHVADVGRSIAYYQQLGFQVGNTFTPPYAKGPVWAWLETGQARLMVTLADGPFDAGQQAVLFYIYVDDVEAARADLEALGVGPGPIQFPFHAPKGEFRLEDPDGYVLMVRPVS